MRIRMKNTWTIFKVILIIICIKYSLIVLKYLYFVRYSSFPLEHTSDIVKEILDQGFTNATPINYIHKDTKLLPNAKNVCVNKILLLIVVKSAIHHFERRNSIRRTWGKWAVSKIKVVFILGYIKAFAETVNQEIYLYNDIVQGGFVDSYANNTYKTIMMYNWIIKCCQSAENILFVDDDFFVHIPNVLNFLNEKSIDKYDNVMYGRMYFMARPVRNKESKWYISANDYPFDFWPQYLAGGSILTNAEVVRKIAIAMPYVKFICIDDAFLGIVANKINTKLIHEPGFVSSGKVASSAMTNYLTSHGYSDSLDLVSAWEECTGHTKQTVPLSSES